LIMAENSWPFNNADTTETQFIKLFRTIVDSGIVSGLVVSAAGGMNLNLSVGSAVVDTQFYENTTIKGLVVEASDALPRKDYVILRRDTDANTTVAVVKKGTTSGGGTLPTLTRTLTVFEWPIAVINVPGGAVSLIGGNLEARVTSLSLRTYVYASAGERDLLDLGGMSRAIGFNSTTRTFDYYNGSWSGVGVAWATISGKPATFPAGAHSLDSHAGLLALSKGGTGQSTAAGARAAIDAAASAHYHYTTDLIGSTGTGRALIAAADAAAARELVGIRVTNTPMTAGTPVNTLRFW
jgi:hypothetical protein